MADSKLRFSTLVDAAPNILGWLGAVGIFMLAACEPSVQVKAPTEPITINLNVKLDAEVRVKLEKQAEEDIRKNKDIF